MGECEASWFTGGGGGGIALGKEVVAPDIGLIGLCSAFIEFSQCLRVAGGGVVTGEESDAGLAVDLLADAGAVFVIAICDGVVEGAAVIFSSFDEVVFAVPRVAAFVGGVAAYGFFFFGEIAEGVIGVGCSDLAVDALIELAEGVVGEGFGCAVDGFSEAVACVVIGVSVIACRASRFGARTCG